MDTEAAVVMPGIKDVFSNMKQYRSHYSLKKNLNYKSLTYEILVKMC